MVQPNVSKSMADSQELRSKTKQNLKRVPISSKFILLFPRQLQPPHEIVIKD